MKLTLVQVAFYAIWPGNGLGLFYNNSARDSHGPADFVHYAVFLRYNETVYST